MTYATKPPPLIHGVTQLLGFAATPAKAPPSRVMPTNADRYGEGRKAKPTRFDPQPNHAPMGKRRRQWR